MVPSSPSLRATKASAAGARRARGVLLAYPAGRAPVPKVTTSRCSIPRPPRGVAKADFARLDYYDMWFPNLSPSAELVKEALGAVDEREWAAFRRAQMGLNDARAGHLRDVTI